MTGATGAFWFAARQSPPWAIQRWQEGAWGEELTAAELDKLAGEGWTVLNDLRRGRYNVDHVVIGPTGVFCLNSKKSGCELVADPTSGSVALRDRTHGGLLRTDDRVLSAARREAASVSALIQERTGVKVWVQPVVVWWGTFDQRSLTVAGVAVVHGRSLAERLTAAASAQPRHVQDIDAVVRALAPGRRRRRQASTA